MIAPTSDVNSPPARKKRFLVACRNPVGCHAERIKDQQRGAAVQPSADLFTRFGSTGNV